MARFFFFFSSFSFGVFDNAIHGVFGKEVITMGFDVYGKDPDPGSGSGEYFRNNVWWWRPLRDNPDFQALVASGQ